ncbi:efflux RND transporter permease subunit [Iodidimonas sp. SYSU 1G8]|uniref:efflux RND transporter permease subunit n=1 Tax=Iodidimonas sp. SYSU 1G8 TaxID=3133967 RepID=UPI0031FE66B6
MGLADFCIRRPVFAVMLIAGLVALGWLSIGRVGIDLFPRVEYPFIAVSTVLEGATPETVETEVTDALEEKLNTISGIKTLRSVSSEGLSQIFLEFELNENVDVKSQEVRDRIALARADIPVEAEPPVVEKVDPDSEPIMSVLVAGDFPVRDLTTYADDVVKEALQRIPGVGSVELVGGREREVRIWLDADRLRGFGVSAQQVLAAIGAEHAEIPGGRLEAGGGTREFSVKTKGEVESVAAFGDIVVAFRDGAPTWLRDVARIEDGVEDERTYAELGGKRGVSLDIRRQSGKNTVAVASEVRAALAALERDAPAGLELVVAKDVARFIESSIRDVSFDMVLGGFLAAMITFIFLLDSRSTLIVAVAIPTSVVATFFAFYVAGFTVNMLTMMALSVSVGLLVDDAIVVVESIHRYIQAGEPPLQAASKGVRRVGAAVLAGTLTIVAVFVPIAFMEGLVGAFFFQYGLSVSFAVMVSWLISMTLTPMLASRFLTKHEAHGPVLRRLEGFHTAMEAHYRQALAATLRRRWVAMVALVAAIYLGVTVAALVPNEFMPRTDRSEFTALVQLPLGTGIEETKQVAGGIAREIETIGGVTSVFVTVGAGVQNKVNEASYYIALAPKADRDDGQFAIMDKVRAVLDRHGAALKSYKLLEIPWVSGGAGSAPPVEQLFQGRDLRELDRLSQDLAAKMRPLPAFQDVKTSFETGKPELQIHVDRQRAADLGVSVDRLAGTVRALVGGIDAGTYQEGGERHDVRIRLEEGQRDDLDRLSMLQIPNTRGDLVDIDNVATLAIGLGPVEITRMDRSRMVAVTAANSSSVTLGQADAELHRLVSGMTVPPGYTARTEGMAKTMKESTAAVGFAFGMALLVIYMVLASQFNSFTQPAIMMLCAPLAFIGAFLGIWLEGSGLSLFAQIGLVVLMGLVMKNGILLVEYANQFREEHGMDARTAMLEAAPLRLRPILMTALAAIFGMIPIALATSDGAEWRRPMGVLVIGGLLSSTFLTLLIVPVAYTLMADAGGLMRRMTARLRGRRAPAE